jgi:hypothetical protein
VETEREKPVGLRKGNRDKPPQTFSKWTKKQERPEFVQVHQAARRGIPQAHSEILIESGEMKIHLPLNMGVRELCVVVECVGGLL